MNNIDVYLGALYVLSDKGDVEADGVEGVDGAVHLYVVDDLCMYIKYPISIYPISMYPILRKYIKYPILRKYINYPILKIYIKYPISM
jgi:hypothetical protein